MLCLLFIYLFNYLFLVTKNWNLILKNKSEWYYYRFGHSIGFKGYIKDSDFSWGNNEISSWHASLLILKFSISIQKQQQKLQI